MVGTAGFVIIFVCAMVGCGISTILYLLFACHYFLTTVIDSAAGHEEVHFPREAIVDWWWKPIFCLWILAFWVVFGSILGSPFLAHSPLAFGIVLGALLWFAYPLSVLSVLHTQNWLFFVHPVLAWRMLRHFWALAYVHLVTLAAAAVCVALLFGALRQSLLWALPAMFLIPAALLFHARTWGRFAWLSLNFAPRKKKPPRSPYKDPPERNRPLDDAPAMEVEEIDERADGSMKDLPVPAMAVHAEDEWATDNNPYHIAAEPGQPGFQEKPVEPSVVPAAVQISPPPAEETEDEWATDKKPYGLADEPAPTATDKSKEHQRAKAEADQTMSNSQYYDERAKRETEAKRKAKEQAESNHLPTLSKKTPTFTAALLTGVGKFMIDGETMGVWANLVILTVVELFFLFLVVKFWPSLD